MQTCNTAQGKLATKSPNKLQRLTALMLLWRLACEIISMISSRRQDKFDEEEMHYLGTEDVEEYLMDGTSDEAGEPTPENLRIRAVFRAAAVKVVREHRAKTKARLFQNMPRSQPNMSCIRTNN